MLKLDNYQPKYHIFGSKILSHIVFWAGYYLTFSLIWSEQYGVSASFFLEFILLPPRMLAVYLTLYWLMPHYLLVRRYLHFVVLFFILLIACALLQRVFIYWFYEEVLIKSNSYLWDIKAIGKSSLLINTTVLLAVTIKLVGIVDHLFGKQQRPSSIHIRANRKTHIIDIGDIMYIEGLGNYINYYLVTGEKITHYSSIKKTLETLPENFVRIHKSYIVNRFHISSFNHEVVTINDTDLPRNKSTIDKDLLPL